MHNDQCCWTNQFLFNQTTQNHNTKDYLCTSEHHLHWKLIKDLENISNRTVYSVKSSSLLLAYLHPRCTVITILNTIFMFQIICTIFVVKLTWGADSSRNFFVTGALMGTNVLFVFCLKNWRTMFLWNIVPTSHTTHSEDCSVNIQCFENFNPPTGSDCLHLTTQGTTLPTI